VFTATAQPISGTLKHRIDVNGRHEITTDEPKSLGGLDTAPAPHELLPAMLASCVSTMIILYAQKRGWILGDVSVDVRYDNESTPRQVSTQINLPDGLTADQIQRLERVAETCPVKRALEAGFSFEHRIVTPAGKPHELTGAMR
jgi:putative redox protein